MQARLYFCKVCSEFEGSSFYLSEMLSPATVKQTEASQCHVEMHVYFFFYDHSRYDYDEGTFKRRVENTHYIRALAWGDTNDIASTFNVDRGKNIGEKQKQKTRIRYGPMRQIRENAV